ncbi:MAG: hypothetical protein AB1608_09805, partial [Thermoproteota archaeon]
LGITDNTTRTATKSLTENLGLTDNTARTATKSLTENLGITDNIEVIVANVLSLSENMGISDHLDAVPTKSLREKLGITDTVSFKGGVKIEARDLSNMLVDGATYMVSPNPQGGSMPMTVIDGGMNDNDAAVDGKVVFGSVPFGTYNFTITTIPTGYNVLGNHTLYEAHRTQVNGTAIFKVVLQNATLSTMPPAVITTPPSLNDEAYNSWTSTYNAVVRNETSVVTVDRVNQLPPIISVGNESSSTDIDNAILKQASVQLGTVFASQTSGKDVIETFGVLNYSLPESPELISVIPSFVTQPSGTQPQYIASPPLAEIIPGQMMIMPVEDELLPTWGGVAQVELHPLDTASSTTNDWLVIETSPTIPSSIGTSGIAQTNVNLFVDVKYRFEEEGVGFDWSQEANHQTDPVLKLRVEKLDDVVTTANGCPVLTPYTFSGGSWVQTGVSISSPVEIDADTCEVDMTVQHFSRFSLASTPSTPSSGPSDGAPSGGAGAGGGAGGGGGGAVAGEGGFGGRLVSPIVIYEISYDVCETNMVRIIAGVIGSDQPAPHVKIRTPLKEVYSATLAQYQPYTEANKLLSVSRYVYEAQLDPKLNFFIVTAEQTGGRAAVTATYTVNVEDCRNTIIINPMSDIDQEGVFEPTPETGRPNIFDVKFQINANKPASASVIDQYLEPKDNFKVSAIVDSPSTIRRAELRVNVAGGNFSNYAAVKMDVTPLQNITNAYIVSAELPPSFLQAPAIVYWIHAINNEEKAQSSERYVIGVKPKYDIDARIELDSPPSKAQGTTYNPTSYVLNEGEHQLFGTVSLLVNDEIVYTSPEQLFNKGQSVVDLKWDVPESGAEAQYEIRAQLNLYDKVIKTSATPLKTFQATKTLSILQPIQAASITYADETIARVGLLYSSDINPTLHYRVVAPDGTCLIGQSDSCLVKDSTAANRGNTVSVELDGQIYRIRYSGVNNPLERFSITSIDPIVGTWSVTLESEEGIIPEAQAMEDIQLKLKYRATYTKLITVASD